jgi:hypothetical protein
MTDSIPTGLHVKVEALRVELHQLINGAQYRAIAPSRRSATSQSLLDSVDDALDRLRYHLG